MIILQRLAHGVWDHAGVRFTEWLGGGLLLGLGYVMLKHPDTIYATASFKKLAEWGDASTWALVLLICGAVRVLSLFVNGTFPQFTHSPTLRFIASCLAALFLMQWTLGVYSAYKYNDGALTGVVAYGIYMIMELRNAYVSRVDMAATREANNARTFR